MLNILRNNDWINAHVYHDSFAYVETPTRVEVGTRECSIVHVSWSLSTWEHESACRVIACESSRVLCLGEIRAQRTRLSQAIAGRVFPRYFVFSHKCLYNIWEHWENVLYFFYEITRRNSLLYQSVNSPHCSRWRIMAWTFPCFPYSYNNTAFSQSKLTFSKYYFINICIPSRLHRTLIQIFLSKVVHRSKFHWYDWVPYLVVSSWNLESTGGYIGILS